MSSSKAFHGIVIPSTNTPYAGAAPYYIKSGGCRFIWESSAPSSGGTVQISVLNISDVANTLSSAMTGSNIFDLVTGVFTPVTVNGTQFIGQVGKFTSTGVLPTGILAGTSYFTYPINTLGGPTQFQFFSTTASVNYAMQVFRGNQVPATSSGLLLPTDNGTPGDTLTFTPTGFVAFTATLQHSNSFAYSADPNLGEGPTTNIKNTNILPLSSVNFFRLSNNQVYEGNANLSIAAVTTYTLSYRTSCAKYMSVNFQTGNGAGCQLLVTAMG